MQFPYTVGLQHFYGKGPFLVIEVWLAGLTLNNNNYW